MLYNKSFLELGLKNIFIKKLNDMGYKKPFPIQIECIPKLIKGIDVLGVAQTGSGKTIAFIIPFLDKIDIRIYLPQILIIEPTRELVIQTSKVAFNISNKIKNINIISLYGGNNYSIEINNLKKKSHLIIGTPGRLLDHINKGNLNLSEIKGLILDEADEMLKMGFINDIEKILSKISNKHQTALFSATMPYEIKNIAYKFMNNPEEIKIDDINHKLNIKQNYYIINKVNKNESLIRFIEITDFNLCIIFTNTKSSTLEIFNLLKKYNYNVSYINGDLNQQIREKTIDLFKKEKINILVATDIVSRGLDINNVNFIINYDSPKDLDTYIHRIGRTGRAGKFGQTIIFLKNYEINILKNIKKKYPDITQSFLPEASLINKVKLDKFKSKIKEIDLNKEFIKYNKITLELLSYINNDYEKLISIILSICQDYNNLIFLKELKDNVNYNKLIKKDKNHTYVNIIKINLGLIDSLIKKDILNFLIYKLNINSRLIKNIRIFNNFSEIKVLKSNLNKLNYKNFKIKNKLVKIEFINKR